MVTIHGVREADCIWCGKHKECLDVTTEDRAFSGALCIPDLKRMLRLKSGSQPIANGKPDVVSH
jgi:hypothetical protein